MLKKLTFSSRITFVLKSLLFSYLLTAGLLLLLSLLLYRFSLSERIVSISITGMYIVVTFLAGFLAGKREGSRKFLWGLMMGCLYFLILAFFLNVAGDLFFILVCSMGVGGSALATTLSQAVCTVLSLTVLERKMRRLGMDRAERWFDRTEFARMMRIAVPAALQQSVVSLGSVCVQTVTNSFGPAVIAGCSAANKAVNLVSTVPINWGNALSNFVGQNMGAEKPERIGQGVKVSLLVTGVLSLVMVLVMELMPKTLIGWFVEGEGAAEVVRVGASYLRVTGLFLVIFSVYMVMKSVFKGAGDMNWYVGLTLGSLGVRVFCAFLLAPVFGESILWWSVAVGWCVSAVPTVLHYLGGSWKKHSLVGKL